MTQAEIEALSSKKLFGCCASHFDDEQYWEEFVRRFNECLTRSVYYTYRQFNREDHHPLEVISDLLQEVYIRILKDKCSYLRRFRGKSDTEAEVYLMNLATGVTIDRLRRQHTLKRHTQTESLDDPDLQEAVRKRLDKTIINYTDKLAENDVIKILQRGYMSKHSERDILIFLLHFRDGFTPQEISKINIFGLRPSSISNILARMRQEIREALFIEKS